MSLSVIVLISSTNPEAENTWELKDCFELNLSLTWMCIRQLRCRHCKNAAAYKISGIHLFCLKSQIVPLLYPHTKMLNQKINNQVVALIWLGVGRER